MENNAPDRFYSVCILFCNLNFDHREKNWEFFFWINGICLCFILNYNSNYNFEINRFTFKFHGNFLFSHSPVRFPSKWRGKNNGTICRTIQNEIVWFFVFQFTINWKNKNNSLTLAYLLFNARVCVWSWTFR